MARRPGVTRDKVISAAAEAIDEHGSEGLTLAGLAQRFGIRTPSLYTHVEGIDDVREAVRLRVLEDLAEVLQRAAVGRSGRDALHAIAEAYRSFALEHPGRYGLSLRGDAHDPAVAAAAGRILETVTAVFRGYGIDGEAALHATRALRSALHGFVSLELAGGFAMDLDVDASYERFVDLLDDGFRRIGATAR